MELRGSGRASALVVSLAVIAACGRADLPAPTTAVGTDEPPPSVTATATASPTPTPQPRVMAEAEAWAEVRAALPGVPVILPTWLPFSIERTRVELRELRADPSDPRYAIAYVAPNGAAIVVVLGPAGDVTGSGIGTRVRNRPAVLSFDSNLWSDASKPSLRRVRWTEGPYVLRLDAERFTGEDLLHVAWSLDRTGAPAPKNPYTRVKPGACAASGAAPEDTVRRLLAFVGVGDRDSVMDCFSLELLGEYPGYGAWADLPRAGAVKLSPPSAIAGRFVVGASWSFAMDPGGAWSQQPHHFFTLGLEDGSWRIYEMGTAAISPPP
jgi:hypothetical protein